ncbi:MAG: LEPR-XLL domain-containing protein [Kiritimatiellae bacterium]|nr:LEPR-XLL domain-containing protein [Kiritimatiellia bacterium]
MKTHREPSDFELQALEPRIMLSADAADLLAGSGATEAVLHQGETAPDDGLPLDGETHEPVMFEPVAASATSDANEESPMESPQGVELVTADTFSAGDDLFVDANVELKYTGSGNFEGPNTYTWDTTRDSSQDVVAPEGNDITILGTISGSGEELGGTIYLNAGTDGDILIKGDIGLTDPLGKIVIVNARHVTLEGNIQLHAFEQRAGTGNTTIGSGVSIRNLTLTGGDMEINTQNNVTFESEVVIEKGGNIDLEVVPESSGSAKITFRQTLDVKEGNLLIRDAKSVEFVKEVDVAGKIEQIAGTLTTVFRADVDAHEVDLLANNRISFEKSLRMGQGDLTLTSNDVKFLGGPDSVVGALDNDDNPLSNLLIRPISESASIDIGAPTGPSGTLKFTSSDIGALKDGFNAITFGYETDGTGAIRAGQASFRDPLNVYGGSFVINGFLHARTAMMLDASTGNIDITGGQVRVFNEQFDSQWGDGAIQLVAHEGNILLRNNGLIEVDNNDNNDPDQGSTIDLTATLGEIVNQTNSEGLVIARDLTALAAGDIILLTEIATLDAHSTVEGEIRIIEQSGLHVLSAITANGAQDFRVIGGNTTIDLAESETDDEENTLDVVVLSGNLSVGQLLFGSEGDVTIEVEGHLRGFESNPGVHIEANVLDILSETGVGQPTNPLRIRANALDVENLDDGAVVIRQFAGRSQLLVQIDNKAEDDEAYVSLTSLGANTVIHGEGLHAASDAGIRVETSSVLNIEADVSGQGGLITFLVGGSSGWAEEVTVSSGGGDIRFDVKATLEMSKSARLVSLGGNVVLTTEDDLILGQVDAATTAGPQSDWGNVAITSGGFLRDTQNSALTNVRAHHLRLQSETGIGQLPTGGTERTLEIDATRLAALTNAGVIAIRDINNLIVDTTDPIGVEIIEEDGSRDSEDPVSTLSDVRNTGGGDILFSAAETLGLNSSEDAVITQGGGNIAIIAEAMHLDGNVNSSGGQLSLGATNDITLSATSDLITTGAGTIAVNSSDGSVLASATSAITTGSGAIMISAQNNLTLGTVSTGGAIGLRAVTGTLRAAAGGNAERIVVAGNTLAVVAGGGVNGPSDAATAFKTDVNTLSLQGGTGTLFRFHNSGTLTIDTTSASATLYNTMMSGSPLAIAAYSNAVISGSGNLSIVFDAGDGILAPNRIVSTGGTGSIVFDAGDGILMGTASRIQTVHGDIELTANDDITIAKVSSEDGDITVTSATGAIVDADSEESAVDFETDGQLSLYAETGIGMAGDDWQSLTVLLGTLRAETNTGGIFVASAESFATNGLVTASGNSPIHVMSGGSLAMSGNENDVAASAHGLLVLSADEDLTQSAGSAISAELDISITAGGVLTLAKVTTPENVALDADTVIGIPGTEPTEITANGLLLDSVGALGEPGQPLRLAISALAGLVTQGTLAFENDGDLTLGQAIAVTTLQLLPAASLVDDTRTQDGQDPLVDGTGVGIFAVLTGNLHVLDMADATLQVTEALPVLWQNDGDQTWEGHFTLGGGDLTLRSGGGILIDLEDDAITSGGNGLLEAQGAISILADSAMDFGTGSYLLRAGDDIRLDGSLSASGHAALIAGDSIYTELSGGPTRITATDLILSSGFRIGGNVISTEVSRIAAHTGPLGIHLANTGDLVVTNLGFSVPALRPDASVDIAFSGHLGGLVTQQSGAINLTTTGALDVHEVAAVIEAFPGGDKTISILSDVTGPAGNEFSVLFEIVRSDNNPIDASEAQDDSDLRDGNPPTTKFLPGENILKVFVRNNVSTLQEIIDAINADMDFPGTAVQASGSMDGSDVFTHPSDAETLFAAAGGRHAGVVSHIAGEFQGGAEPISAVADIQPFGEFYTLRFTALVKGEAANDYQVRLLDDGPGGRLTDGANEAEVEWDEANGLLNIWINHGFTTVGTVLNTVNDAMTHDDLPFSAELAGSFLPSDLNDILGDKPVTLVSNLAASAVLRPTGSHNDFEVVATVGGNLYNGIKFEFVDTGVAPANGAAASFDPMTNLMTITIQSGVSTANQVIAALNDEGTFSAALVPQPNGSNNNGTGTIQATRFLLSGGTVGVQAKANLVMAGSNNNFSVTADEFGADENGIQVVFIRDASLGLAEATASYDATARVLELRGNPDFVTAGAYVEAINTGPNSASIPLTAALLSGESGFGAIQIEAYPLTSGGTGGPARAEFIALGDNNDFMLEAASESPSLENIKAFLIDDGTITDDSATAVYLSGPRHLILNVRSGVTTLNTLISVINSSASETPVNASLLPGNDGTGVFNLEAVDFSGGADPVHAVNATTLANGLTVILESSVGGVVSNGIQVSYATDGDLDPGTAEAHYLDVDGVRLLSIRVADANTTVAAIADALAASELPFFVNNLAEIGAMEVGELAPAPEGDISLQAEGDISLVGRILSESGAVRITTTVDGDLTFDAETTRIHAITDVEIDLAGAFANRASLENPLIRNYDAGTIRMLTGNRDTLSEEPVYLLSRGDLEIGGEGFASDNTEVEGLADGNIFIHGTVDTGTGQIVFDAGDGFDLDADGSLTGGDITVTSENEFTQDGHIEAVGPGEIRLMSASANLIMGGDATTVSEFGDISLYARGDIGATAIASTDGGNISLQAGFMLNESEEWVFSPGGAILDTHATNGLNLSTDGHIVLRAQNGIGAILDGDLKTNSGSLQLLNEGESGDIVITETASGGNLEVTELVQNADNGWSIITVEDGNALFSGSVTHSGDGALRVQASGNIQTQETVSLAGGHITFVSDAHILLAKDVDSGGGDISMTAGGLLDMAASMTMDAEGGNVLLNAQANISLAQVSSENGHVRIVSNAASIIRASFDGRTNVIAASLQLRAAVAVGSFASQDAALFTDVDLLTATALNGTLALRDLSDANVGESEISVASALADRSTTTPSWTETQLRTANGNAVLRVDGDLTVEDIPGTDPTISVNGNLRVEAGGSATLDGETEVTSGSAQLLSGDDLVLNADLTVSGGTLLVEAGGDFTQTNASVVDVEDEDAILASGGTITVNRMQTGDGTLALTAVGSILRQAGAPNSQVIAAATRLQSGADIGSDALHLVLITDTVTAHATGLIRFNTVGSSEVNAVSATAHRVSVLGTVSEVTVRTEAAQSDLRSSDGGNIRVRTQSGVLSLYDGNGDGVAVATNGDGHVFLRASTMNVYANVQTVNGELTMTTSGATNFLIQPESSQGAGDGSAGRLLSTAGDIHVTASNTLFMEDGTQMQTAEGNLRAGAPNGMTVANIEAPQGLVSLSSSSGAVLDGGDTHLDVVADQLQIIAGMGVGLLGASYNPLDTQVNKIAVWVSGDAPLAIAETMSIEIGAVGGSVDRVNLAGTPGSTNISTRIGLLSQGGGSVSLTAVGNINVSSNGAPGVSAAGTGNVLLSATGTGSVLMVSDNLQAIEGHISLLAMGALTMGPNVTVSTGGPGTMTVRSQNAGITQNAGGTLSTESGDVVLQAAGGIVLSQIATDASVSVTSNNGSITDGDPTRVNVEANTARFRAGTSIATGANPLNLEVNTVSAHSFNGGIYLREETGLNIGATFAVSQIVQPDATLQSNSVDPQSGLVSGGTAGTIVTRAVDGNLTVLPGNPVTASQAGNILLAASEDVSLFAPVGSGTGTITLEAENDLSLATGILVSTGGNGQVHGLAGGAINALANSRFVANNGNVVLGAQGNVLLGGIQTGGRAAIGSLFGAILGAGSTNFNHEVVASRLMLTAPTGGVGTLHPNVVQTFRTNVSRVAAVAGPLGLNLVNSTAIVVNEVVIEAQRVTNTGSLQALPTQSLSDLATIEGDGPIVLRTTSGNITLTDGANADGIAVSAHGAGNVRIDAAGNLIVNAAVGSAAGHVTLRGANDITFGAAGKVLASAPGTIYVRAAAGGITMHGDAEIIVMGSAARLRAAGNIVLGRVLALDVSLISINGSVQRAAGSLMNLGASSLRIQADAGVGAPTAPLTTGVATLSVHTSTGGIYLLENDDVTVGGISIGVFEVKTDADITPVDDPQQSGLSTGSNGNIVLVSAGGSVTVAAGAPVNAHGTGNIRLDADTQLLLNANVSSGSGHISLLGGNGLQIAENVTVTTASPGSVDLDAGEGDLILPAVGGVNAPGGPVRLASTGDMVIGSVVGGNLFVRSSEGSILKAAGSGLNLTGSALQLWAAQNIGLATSHLTIAVNTLSARSGTGIFLSETNGITVTSTELVTTRVLPTGSTQNTTEATRADLRTTDNGDIVLLTLGGSITLNDGDGNNRAVSADGTGSIRLQSASNLTANVAAGIFSDSGHITLRAQNNLNLAALTVETAAPGDISLSAVTGALGMVGQTQVRTPGGRLRVFGRGNVTLGNLTAMEVSAVSENGALVNATGTSRNVTATRARLEARLNIGVANRRITTTVEELAALSQLGNIYLTELNAVHLTGVAINVTEFTANGGTQSVGDGMVNGLVAADQGDVVLVAGGNLTVDNTSGGIVNLFSGGALAAGDGSPAHVTAESLLLRAQNDIGAPGNVLVVDTNVLSAHSVTGNIYIDGIGDFAVGSVLNLSTPADPNDVQTGVRALAGDDVFLTLSGDLTLGWVTGDTVSLVADGGIFASGSGPHVEADALRMQTGTGVGATGAYLIINVDIIAAFAEDGDILLSRPAGNLEVGSVFDAELLPTTLSGLTTQNGGDIVLLVGGQLTVTDPVSAADNVRLSAQGDLLLGLVSGTEISLLSTGEVLNAWDLPNNLTATSLRIAALGDIGSATTPLTTEVDFLSAVSQNGGVWLTEATDAALASVSVEAGGQTDAAQHGVSGETGVVLISLAGRWLDGGDAEDDIRSPGPVTLVGATGLGTTGAGALEISTPELTASTVNGGSVYLNLTIGTIVQGLQLGGPGNLYLNVNGDLTLNGTVSLPAGSAYLTVQGDVWIDANMEARNALRIIAANLFIAENVQVVSAEGNLDLRTGGDLVMSAGSLVEATQRNLRVLTGGDLTIARMIAGRNVDLQTSGLVAATSLDRADHEMVAPTLRIRSEGTMQTLLTDVDRLDVQAMSDVEIVEAGDLIAGRYGLRILSGNPDHDFVLQIGQAELGSLNPNGVIADMAGTFKVESGETVTLAARLVNTEGGLALDVNGVLLSIIGSDPALDAANGRVSVLSTTGAGVPGSGQILVSAEEFMAVAASGSLAFTFLDDVIVTSEGVVLSGGSGAIRLDVQSGDLILRGRVLNNASGNLNVNVPQGRLEVQANGLPNLTTDPLLRTGNELALSLDTGITLSGVGSLRMFATTHSAVTRTGNLNLNLRSGASDQLVRLRNFRIEEGTGSMNLSVTGNLVLLSGYHIQNLASSGGGLTLTATNFLSLASDSLLRNNNGALVLTAVDIEINRVESYGSSTRFTVTNSSSGRGIRRRDGTGTALVIANHQVVYELYSGQWFIDIQTNAPSAVLTTLNNGNNISLATNTSVTLNPIP